MRKVKAILLVGKVSGCLQICSIQAAVNTPQLGRNSKSNPNTLRYKILHVQHHLMWYQTLHQHMTKNGTRIKHLV